MSKKVTVYSTTGKRVSNLMVEVTNWGDLKKVLSTNSITYNGMKAVVGETKVTLESAKAELPDGDFSLFLMPVKTKSGTGDRKALMAKYKELPDAQAYFKSNGLQITRMKTDDIEKELTPFLSGKAVASKVKEAVSKVIESVNLEIAKEKVGKKSLAEQIEDKKAEIEAATKAGDYGKIASIAGVLQGLEKEFEEWQAAQLLKADTELVAGMPVDTVDYDTLIKEKKEAIDAAMKAANYASLGAIAKELEELEVAKKIDAERIANAKRKAEEAKKAEELAAKKAAEEAEKKIVDQLDKKAREIASDFNDLKNW